MEANSHLNAGVLTSLQPRACVYAYDCNTWCVSSWGAAALRCSKGVRERVLYKISFPNQNHYIVVLLSLHWLPVLDSTHHCQQYPQIELTTILRKSLSIKKQHVFEVKKNKNCICYSSRVWFSCDSIHIYTCLLYINSTVVHL